MSYSCAPKAGQWEMTRSKKTGLDSIHCNDRTNKLDCFFCNIVKLFPIVKRIEFWNESSVPKKGVHLRADVEVIVAKIVTHGQDVVALEDLMSKKSSIKGQFEHTGA